VENPHKVYKNLFLRDPRYNTVISNFGFSYDKVLKSVENLQIGTCLDIGSGRGIMIEYFKENRPEIKVYSTDLEKFHHHNVDFMEIDLFKPETLDRIENEWPKMDLVTCLDVMEHLPLSVIDGVLQRLSRIGRISIFTIANHPDIHDGVELHLTKENSEFWSSALKNHYEIAVQEDYLFGANELYYFACYSKAFL